MSHFTEIKLTLTGSVDDIVNALCKVDCRATGKKFTKEQIEVHSVRSALYGYRGDKREQSGHIVIRRGNVGSASNDIGFERKADGTWIAHISDFDRGFYSDKWLNHLRAYNAMGKACGWAGASKWTAKETEENGKRYIYVEIAR